MSVTPDPESACRLDALPLLVLAAPASADVHLPHIFGDHMMLQADQTVAIWGRADFG